MSVALKKRLPLVPCLLAMLLLSCQMPQQAKERPSEGAGSGAGDVSKFDPSNAEFDLEAEGLKKLWGTELGQLTGGRLRDIYCTGPYVVVEAEEGEVHFFDARDYGKWLNATVLKDELILPPVSMGKTLYLVAADALFSYDLIAGRLSDPYHPPFAMSAAPVPYKDSLILVGSNGHVARLTASEHDQLWVDSIDGPIMQPPVVHADRVYAAAYQDRVIALDAEQGGRLWTWGPNRPSELTSGVAVGKAQIFFGDIRGFIYCRRLETPTRVWTTMADAPVIGQPRVEGDRALVLTSTPRLYCLRAGHHEAELLWQYPGAERILAAGEEALYVYNGDHSVAGLSLADGQELWRHPLPRDCRVTGDPSRPAFYAANSMGSIAAFVELD